MRPCLKGRGKESRLLPTFAGGRGLPFALSLPFLPGGFSAFCFRFLGQGELAAQECVLVARREEAPSIAKN
jgi:hypothetical protein